MGGRGRPGPARRVEREFWRLISAGLPSVEAGLGAGVSTSTGTKWFRDAGGMPPERAVRTLSPRFLSLQEREDIAVWRAQQVGVREIARRLGRSPSTISRELRRNVHRQDVAKYGGPAYRASRAQQRAEQRRARPKPSKLLAHPPLQRYVQSKLEGRQRWSPEQISERIRVEFPDDERMRISHEAIYQALYVQGRGALRRELTACLRTGRAMRKPVRRADRRQVRIQDKVMISDRPAEAEDRAVPGHWEGDLILGIENKSAIGTLVERTTRFVMLLHLPQDHGALAVRDAIASAVAELPEHLRRSLTWDQGIELAQHAQLSTQANLPIYFCDPHSPWQRGTNENTNGLLRQYFPKGTDLKMHDERELREVAAALNGRPRKTLQWRTPAEALSELLSSA